MTGLSAKKHDGSEIVKPDQKCEAAIPIEAAASTRPSRTQTSRRRRKECATRMYDRGSILLMRLGYGKKIDIRTDAFPDIMIDSNGLNFEQGAFQEAPKD